MEEATSPGQRRQDPPYLLVVPLRCGLRYSQQGRAEKVFGMLATDVAVAKGKKFAKSLNSLSFYLTCQQSFHGAGPRGEAGREALASYRVNIRSPFH